MGQRISTTARALNIQLLTFFFVLATGVLYFVGHDRYGLFDVDEAIFTQASVEMLESGDYVRPTYNAEPRYHKPPLIYWFQSASIHHFGDELGVPTAARMPSAVFGFMTVLLLFAFIDRMTGDRRLALIIGSVFAFNLSWLVVVRASTADAALNFFMLATTLPLLANLYGGHNRLYLQIIAGLMGGLALLAKGPIGVAVPGAIVLLAVLCRQGSIFRNLNRANPLLLGLVMLVTIAPWLWSIYAQHGWEFFKEFWLVHNWQRFTSDLGNSHSGSYFYYVGVLLFGLFPWMLFAPGALLRSIQRLPHLFSRELDQALPWLGLLWGVLVVGLFTFSGTKLAHYIVPGYAGFAIWLGYRLRMVDQEKISRWQWFIIVPLAALVALPFLILPWAVQAALGEGPLAPLIPLFNPSDWPVTDPQTLAILLQDVQVGYGPFIVGLLAFMGVTGGLRLLREAQPVGVLPIAFGWWAGLLLIILNVVPTVWQYTQAPLAELAEVLTEQYEPGNNVQFVSIHRPSVRLLSKIPYEGVHHSQVQPVAEKNQTFYLVEQQYLTHILDKQDAEDFITTDCRGGFCLVQAADIAYTAPAEEDNSEPKAE